MEAKQVLFYDKDNQESYGGVLIDNRYLVCGCCGGVFDLEDEDDRTSVEIVDNYAEWVNISDEIVGNY